MAKVKRFSDERVLAEIVWMADHKIEVCYNCDANYGLFERDIELTRRMVEIKKANGYPKKFRAAYAKNSNDSVFAISKMLNDAGMSKGTTLSFQSLDQNTLSIVKRKNIQVKDFQALMQRYNENGIPTYSEIIVALPGETYDSFANGLNTLISAGQHSGLNCYLCECLPNSELNEPTYREKYGIKSVECPVLVYHGTPDRTDEHRERYEVITETATLPPEDWLKCMMLAWVVQACHCLNLTQAFAVFMHGLQAVSYRKFYEKLLAWALADGQAGTLLGQAAREARTLFAGIREGKEWGIVDQRFGNIVWPVEEGSFLKCSAEPEKFYREIKPFLAQWIGENEILLSDLIQYQQWMLPSAGFPDGPMFFGLSHDIHEFLEDAYAGRESQLHFVKSIYATQMPKTYHGDLEEFARERVWYGRKGGRFKNNIMRITESTPKLFPCSGGPVVSVFLPTRGRPAQLLKSIDALLSLAADKSCLEFVFKADDDDTETVAVVERLKDMLPVPVRAIISPRGRGYHDMHLWFNEMAKIARGDWFLIWNDDALMTTQGWDQLIKYTTSSKTWRGMKDICLLVLTTIGRPFAQEFFLLRRTWSDVLGHVSLSPHNDTYCYGIAKFLDVALFMPIHVDHLSDRIGDKTREETVEAYKTSIDTITSFEGRRNKIADAVKLLDYMEGCEE